MNDDTDLHLVTGEYYIGDLPPHPRDKWVQVTTTASPTWYGRGLQRQYDDMREDLMFLLDMYVRGDDDVKPDEARRMMKIMRAYE